VPDRVEDQQVGGGAVDGVVEGVPADVVAGSRPPVMTIRPVPNVSGGSSCHCISAARLRDWRRRSPRVQVGVGVPRHHQLGGQRDVGAQSVVDVRARLLGEDELNDAEPLHPVQQWQPQPVGARGGGAVEHLDPAERPPGQSALDRHLLAVGRSGAG
jgi:hypothetical protein